MHPPILVRELRGAERAQLEASRRSKSAFTMRRAQIVLSSAAGQPPRAGCRLLVCRLPSRSPWLNALEPKWVHGKRAVVEPTRKLTAAELQQRLCAYDWTPLTQPLAQ